MDGLFAPNGVGLFGADGADGRQGSVIGQGCRYKYLVTVSDVDSGNGSYHLLRTTCSSREAAEKECCQ